jgi:CDP-glucose 4,6-dehydratase
MGGNTALGSLEKIKINLMEKLGVFYKDKKVLITGHTGFKGSWLTQILLNFGAKVSGIALKPNTKPSLFQILGLERKIKNHFCDIRNLKKIFEIIKKEKPEIIFHLAAQPLVRDSYDDPLYTFRTNIIGTANIFQAIKEIDSVRAVVMITTDKVYENKESGFPFKEDDKLGGYDPYSASKAAAEIVISSYSRSFFNPDDYSKKHKTLVASARAGNVIGGGDWQKDRLVPDIIRAVFEMKEKIIIRNPGAVRPWQYILELLYGYLLLGQELYEGKKDFSGAWNFGPNNKNYLTVEELVKITLELLEKGSYKIEKDYKKHEAHLLKLDNNKSKKLLNWQPQLDISTILKFTCDWYKSFYTKENIIKLTNNQINFFFDKI